MFSRPIRVNYQETIEELGKSLSWVDLDIEAMVYPGEDMVMYYPDGSGYPGSPPEVEILNITAMCFETVEASRCTYRNEKPDWFELLDHIIYSYVMKRKEDYDEKILELAHDYD